MTTYPWEKTQPNNGARTADWIGQVGGRVIYAHDPAFPMAEPTQEAEFTKEDFDVALRRVSRREQRSQSDEVSSGT